MKKRLINLLLSLYIRNLRTCGFEELLPEDDIFKYATALGRLNKHNTSDFDLLATSIVKGRHVDVDNIIKVWDYDDFIKKSRLNNCLSK